MGRHRLQHLPSRISIRWQLSVGYQWYLGMVATVFMIVLVNVCNDAVQCEGRISFLLAIPVADNRDRILVFESLEGLHDHQCRLHEPLQTTILPIETVHATTDVL